MKRTGTSREESESKRRKLNEEFQRSRSHIFDSSDEAESESKNEEGYISILQQGLSVLVKSSGHHISYILTDISNKLLLSEKVTTKYRQIKDPLQFKIGILKEKEFLYQSALIGFKRLNDEVQTYVSLIDQLKNIGGTESVIKSLQEKLGEAKNYRNKWLIENRDYLNTLQEKGIIEADEDEEVVQKIYEIYTQLTVDISKELESISQLQQYRNKCNEKMLKGAFPFVPKQLTATFITKYNEATGSNIEKDKILKSLINIREILADKAEDKLGDLNQLCGLLKVKVETTSAGQYKATTKKSLRTQIENLIGRGPSEDDIKEYIKLNKKELSQDETFETVKGDNTKVVKYIRNKVDEYVTKNSKEIYANLKHSERYVTDPDYLKELQYQDFLVQVRAYRKLNRDIQKDILLSGDEGKRNVPPGLNTTVEITPGGSSSLWLGELGSYSDIGARHLETLKNYGEYTSGNRKIGEKEKEKELTSLSQIEAIRNTSALLTNAMFFELATMKFKPIRVVEGEKEYNFSDIAEQMPMAMSGAVSGSVYLERGFKEKLTGKLPYDYREEGKKTEAEILDTRNKNVLFDWLSSKIKIRDIQDYINSVTETSAVLDSLKNDMGWEVIKSDDPNHLILQDKEGYKITFKKGKLLAEEIKKDIENNIQNNLKSIFNIEKGTIKLECKELGKFIITESKKGGFYIIKNQGDKELAEFSVKAGNKGTKVVITLDTLDICAGIQGVVKKFCLTEFNAFPTKVFNELTEKWYGITLSDLEGKPLEFILKAAAEPKDPNINRDHDEYKPIIIEYKEAIDDNIHIEQDLQISQRDLDNIINSIPCVEKYNLNEFTDEVGVLGQNFSVASEIYNFEMMVC